MYITARTTPEALTDEEVEELDFEEEHDRRLLQAGRIADPTPERPDTPLIGAIRRLVGEHRSSPELRERVGAMGDALAAFLADPSADGLTTRSPTTSRCGCCSSAPSPTSPSSGIRRQPVPLAGSSRGGRHGCTQRRLHAGDLHGALAAAAARGPRSSPRVRRGSRR